MIYTVYQLFNNRKMRNDNYLQQGQEDPSPPSHIYIWQPGDTLKIVNSDQYILVKRENMLTLILNSWVATVNTPEMIRQLLYLNIFQKSFDWQFTNQVWHLHSIPKSVSFLLLRLHLDDGFTSRLFTRSVYLHAECLWLVICFDY